MKKLIIFACILCLSANVFAQKPKRSNVVFTAEKIAELKQRIKQDTEVAAAWNEILARADNELNRKHLGSADYLAIAYLVTKEKKYAEQAKSILLDLTSRENWYDKEMMARNPPWHSHLGLAHNGYNAAILYDGIYDYLSSSERIQIANDLVRLAVVPSVIDWVNEPTRIHSLNLMGHNWWAACVSLGAILGMSVQHEVPEVKDWIENANKAMTQWYAFNGDVLQYKQKTFDPEGGMYESFGYSDYGFKEAMLFRLAWMNTNPEKTPPAIPEIAKAPNFFIQMSYPTTQLMYNVNFGDGSMTKPAMEAMTMLKAVGVKDKNLDWYLGQVTQRGIQNAFSMNTPMGIVFNPKIANVPETPDLPNTQLFSSYGIAAMRDSWENDATLLAVKSGFTWNHAHADANSFILFHKGHDIIKDAGNCNYGNPDYPKYFFQSRAHNVVLFNSEGQPTEQQYGGSPLRGNLYHLLDGGSFKYILANGTGPVAKNFSRNFRHFLWIDNVIYIVDDLKTYETGKFEWLWHPGGEAKKDGMDISITRDNSSVLIRPLYPETLIRTGFTHDFPEKMQLTAIEAPKARGEKGEMETYYSVSYPENVRKVKAVNAIILKDAPEDKNLPEIEKIEGKDWIGLRVKNKGMITDIYINRLADGSLMHLNSCIQADGWDTDAYMFAVQYKEGSNPAAYENLFVGYGSYLRRKNQTYFASLSKLFVIQKQNEKGIDVEIDGQPMVDAFFYNKNKPVFVNLNKEKTTFSYKDGLTNITYGLNK